MDRTIANPAAIARTPASGIDATIAGPATTPTTPAAPAAPGDPLLGATLGGCSIEALLGRGAMGAVYRARQLRLERTVAVKVIRPDLLSDRRALKRFEIEAKTVGRFNSPHVVLIHDVGFEQEMHYLVMEFVPGKNLRDYVKELPDCRIPSDEAIRYLRQACEGLKEAQRLGVLHRDIKPDNLMLGDNGVLKIADFGIAKPLHQDFNMTMTAELMGTPLYMSPEQCRAVEDLDYRSDMFSLGATFFYLLTGEPPVKANSVYELIETKTKIEYLSLSKVLPEMAEDHPLSRIIEKMTALERDDRYGSYDEILRDLQLVEQGEAPLAERPRPRPMQLQTAPRTGGNGFKMAALLLLLAAGGGGAWWAFGGHRAIADNGRHGPTRSEVAAAIDDVRVELRRSGPSAALQQRLTAIDTEDAESSQSKAALLDQLTQATSIKNRLAALEKPETLQLPFTDLRRYYQGLNELEATIRKAGADLQAWASKQVLAARAEGELQGKAQSALMAKWVLWSSELQRANGDAGVLHGLSERLDVITAARALLLEILPGSASALGLELSEQQLLAAHDQVVASRPTDVGARLLAASEKFRREGPTALLRAEVEKITTVDAAQQQLRDRLFDDISRAVEIKATLDNLRAQKTLRAPVPPFTDIRDYYSGIDNALGNLSGRGEEFRAWAAWAAAEARDAAAVRQAASAALAKAWAEWQQARSDAGSDTARLESLRPRLAELENGRRQLGSLCGLDEAELEKIMPAAAAVAAATDLGSVVREQQLLDAIGASSRQLDGISTLKDWLAAQAKLEPAAAGHQHALAELPAAPRARAAIEHLNAGVARWQRAAADALSIVTTLDQGLLADAAERLAAARDTPSDVRDLGVVIEHCSAAFKTLRTELLLDEARKKLRAAHEVTSRLGPFADAVGRRIDAWLAIVDRMEATVKQFDMVPIAGDLVPGPTGQAVPVDAFFLSRAETSRGEFLQFVKELQQLLAPLGDGNWPEKLQQVNPRLGGVLLDEAQLRGLLDKQIAIDPDNPIDRLSWYEATVCARWQHATLLTAAEWSLAALGPQNNRYKYPWGREWTADAGDRNLGNRELAKVRVGGLSWRKGQGVQIHHLGGNVAEWLADGPADDRGWLAGGKYNDLEKVAKEQAAGTMREEPRTQALSGFGMRTGLRPRDCFGSQWPH